MGASGCESHLFWEGCKEAATLSSQNLRMVSVLRAWSALRREGKGQVFICVKLNM